MPEIIFLNMADDLHVDGHKAVEALRRKHPAKEGNFFFSKAKEQVIEVQAVPIYRAWKAGTPKVKEMAQLKKEIANVPKLMLSVHGPMDAVDHGLIRDPEGGPGEKVTYQELGGFLLALLASSKAHNFTLVTCFAARSSNYQLDHQNTGLIDWTDSFAYKLFNELCPAREVRMTARTGELSFNTVTGASEVQTELSIQGTIDNASLRAEDSVVKSQRWWADNLARLVKIPLFLTFAKSLTMANNQKMAGQKLQALRQLRGNHALPDLDPDTAPTLAYLDDLIRLTEACSRQADPVQGKYGKIVYRYIKPHGICVFAKYPIPALLYPPNGVVPTSAIAKFNK
jgi:hypothetical protein